MGILPHSADLATLSTFTPAASRPTAGLPTLSTLALPAGTPPSLTATLPALTVPAATQPSPDHSVATQLQIMARHAPMASSALFPIPEHICTKIVNLEYVDMAELKPSSWLLNNEDTEKASFPFKKRKEPVTDILVWVQCYSAMVSILAERYPSKVPELMAYQSTIVKCAKCYQGLAWVAYDMEFRRKAAKSKSLDWGTIDQSAYAEFFTGSSMSLVRCHVCLEEHPTQQCPQTVNPFMLPPMWMLQNPQYQQQSKQPVQFQHQQTQPMMLRQAPPAHDPPICCRFNSVLGNHCNLHNPACMLGLWRWPQPCAMKCCPTTQQTASGPWPGKAMVVTRATTIYSLTEKKLAG